MKLTSLIDFLVQVFLREHLPDLSTSSLLPFHLLPSLCIVVTILQMSLDEQRGEKRRQ